VILLIIWGIIRGKPAHFFFAIIDEKRGLKLKVSGIDLMGPFKGCRLLLEE
jgi:hypothetical protein